MNFKHVLLGTAAAVSIIALSENNAAVAAHHGWYIGVEGGANWVEKDKFGDFQPFDESDSVNSLEQSFKTGWAVLGTIGYAFDDHWRLEGEFGYRHNSLDKTKTLAGNDEAATTTNSHGDLSEFTLMANALYDIQLTDKLSLSIGAGIGVDDARLKLAAPENECCGSEGEFIDDSHWSFAYQGIAGLNYALNDRLDLFVNYRYLDVTNPNFSNFGEHAGFDDFHKHTVTVGLRWDLMPDEEPMAAPPPAPPPAAPPPAPRQFIVFFGFNKSNLTAEAHHVVQEAAAAAKEYGSASILITGHTDTVGSNRYNMRLSIRRANSTKKALAAEGVAAASISTVGKGETELLVQTADGVKEPQNRRATIDLD